MIPGSSSGNANTNNKNFITYSPQNYQLCSMYYFMFQIFTLILWVLLMSAFLYVAYKFLRIYYRILKAFLKRLTL